MVTVIGNRTFVTMYLNRAPAIYIFVVTMIIIIILLIMMETIVENIDQPMCGG